MIIMKSNHDNGTIPYQGVIDDDDKSRGHSSRYNRKVSQRLLSLEPTGHHPHHHHPHHRHHHTRAFIVSSSVAKSVILNPPPPKSLSFPMQD